MEQTQCYEMLAYTIQMSGNYPEESIQHSEHGESLKSRINGIFSEGEAKFLNTISSSSSSLQPWVGLALLT